MLSIGIGEHKVNQTGKLERTYITRHAKAEQDPFAALANLLAHEIDSNGFSLLDMLQSASIGSETCQQLLWRSRVFFPNTDRDNSGRTRQIESLLESVVKEISGWDKAKDKHTGLFRKTAANNALAAGAASDEINRYFGWKSDVQRRFYAQHHSEAYINIQAVLAGFHKDLIKTAGNRITTCKELQLMWMKHGVMPCYLGWLPLPSSQTCQSEEKNSMTPC